MKNNSENPVDQPAKQVMSIEEYEKLQPTLALHYKDCELRYNVPNSMTVWRVNTLFEKEPSTIGWLESIPAGDILLDVGANVGMYTLFAAVINKAIVYAFEPESQNYALLNKNIYTNNVSDRVTAFCAGLSDVTGVDKLYLSMFSTGVSCHSLGEEVGFDLQPRPSAYAQGSVHFSIDDLVANGSIPVPHFIKIDVDGIEHKVIRGAIKTLSNQQVKSILIEINPNLKEHLELVKWLQLLGFDYDPAQVAFAARKEGDFKNCGEWIFNRKSETALSENKANSSGSDALVQINTPTVLENIQPHAEPMYHALMRIHACPIHDTFYPFMVVDNLFSADYFKEIQQHFPSPEQMISLGETGRVTQNAYMSRKVILFNEEGFSRLNPKQRDFWSAFGAWLYDAHFINSVLNKFKPYVESRLAEMREKVGIVRVQGDALIINDQTNYAISPHTDAAHRLITFLFYLPEDTSQRELGTSLYQPKDPNFSCAGGPHHPAEWFDKIETVEFLPNRALIFVRNAKSFHGVEKIIAANVNRKLVIYNIRLLDA